MIDDLNTTARTLGYLTLLIWMILIVWFTLTIFRRVQHDWRKKRYQEKEWDNRHSDWILGVKPNADTLDLNIEEVYDYQKEHYRDVS